MVRKSGTSSHVMENDATGRCILLGDHRLEIGAQRKTLHG
jgi:hypothetical protein